MRIRERSRSSSAKPNKCKRRHWLGQEICTVSRLTSTRQAIALQGVKYLMGKVITSRPAVIAQHAAVTPRHPVCARAEGRAKSCVPVALADRSKGCRLGGRLARRLPTSLREIVLPRPPESRSVRVSRSNGFEGADLQAQ